MSIERTAATINAYLGEGGLNRVAEDAVYTVMGTGRQAVGRQAIRALLHELYGGAFEASSETRARVIGEDGAVFEYEFQGKHIEEFEGIPATGREVTVPLCVVYTVENDQISGAHIYFEMDALRRQLES